MAEVAEVAASMAEAAVVAAATVATGVLVPRPCQLSSYSNIEHILAQRLIFLANDSSIAHIPAQCLIFCRHQLVGYDACSSAK